MDVPKAMLRLREVENIVGFKHTSIYDQMNKGVFPQPIKFPNGRVRWLKEDIDAWVEAHKAKMLAKDIEARRARREAAIEKLADMTREHEAEDKEDARAIVKAIGKGLSEEGVLAALKSNRKAQRANLAMFELGRLHEEGDS